ncbi:hypothetical protein IIC68_01270 [archaeon]|nr:hypothetical protein [archaeon]
MKKTILVIILVILGVFAYATKVTPAAPEILDTGMSFSNEEQVKNYFSENFETIKNATIDSVSMQPSVFEKYQVMPNLAVVETTSERCPSSCPVSPGNNNVEINYIIYIPIVENGEEFEIVNGWPEIKQIRCASRSEVPHENNGEPACSSGIVESQKRSGGLRYFANNEGKIFFAAFGTPKGVLASIQEIVEEPIVMIPLVAIILTIIFGIYFYSKKKK